MTWPTTTLDTEFADSLASAMASMPEWLDLEPLPDSVFVYEWPDTYPVGPRALVAVPQLVAEAVARDTVHHRTTTQAIEIHLPADARAAIAALGSLRDGFMRLALTDASSPTARVLRARITAFERGKFTSAAASVGGGVPIIPPTVSPIGWSITSTFWHVGTVTLDLLLVR